MSYKVYPPGEALKDVVRYFWSAEIDCGLDGFTMNTFVDDSSGIIFHHHEGKNVVQSRGGTIPKSILYRADYRAFFLIFNFCFFGGGGTLPSTCIECGLEI